MRSRFLNFCGRVCDSLAVLADRFALGAARRKIAAPRLLLILDGEGRPTDLLEVFGVVLAFALGSWLALPFDTFGSSTVFRLLDFISTEGLWAMALLGLAFWCGDAILMNRTRTRHFLTLLFVMLWSCLAILFLLGSPASLGGAVFGVVSLLETLTYRNEYVEDHQ